MCWAHAISPVASMRALSEWLETVPYKKILAFGGDYMLVDGTYGHQKLARMNVAKVLARKIEEGLFTTDRANEIASSLFYKNPAALYGIS